MASRTQSDPGDMIASVGRSWGWILFFGVVTALAGIVITAHPGSSVYAFAILWGAWLFVGGIFRIVESIATPGESMALWRERLFAIMVRHAHTAGDYFNIPSAQVIELGTKIEI